ncbi:MAG TPA: response regulator transcription factor [Terracidiphilus sp.]|jgi:DNA-binding response OmpR family regulator
MSQDLEDKLEPNSGLGVILVIEDDPRMQKVLKRIFTAENYSVEIAGDGKTGLELFQSRQPQAVLLDLILPQVSGRELCQSIKTIAPEMPVVVLSAISDVSDKVLLLEIGADDYVTKPFSPRELLARVQAAIRRRAPLAPSFVCRFGECEINFDKMTAKRAGETVALTSHEFKLVRFFFDNPDRVLSRELLLNEVWGYNSYPTTRTVDNQILKLRQRLEPDPANPKHFLTVYGAGYKFIR